MSTGKRLGRAAVLGLCAGLAVAAAVLGVDAALRLRVDCDGLKAGECEFERTLAAETARLQAFGGLGCALVAAGLYFATRRRTS